MIRAAFIVFLVMLAAVLFTNRSENIVGADASGYANLARMLRDGQATRPLLLSCSTCESHWFVPLGFVASPDRRTMASLYPIGFPLHLALAGEPGLPFVSPLAALLTIVCTYWLGARLHSELAGLIAAMMMGFCAVFILQALQPMSDVVAAMWSVSAVASAVEGRRRDWCSVAAGVCFGIAVLVRPTSALLLPALVLALGGLKPLIRFVLGGIPAAVLLGAYNVEAFGAVLATGYSLSGESRAFALSYFPPRAIHYLRWTVEQFSPFGLLAAGAGLVFLPRRDRWMLGAWMASFYLCYAFYLSYDEWWYTRFLLPAYPALAVAAGVAFTQIIRVRRVIGVAVLIVVVAWEARQVARFSILYTDEDQYDTRLPAQWVARALPPSSIVFSMEFSGSLLYYTGHRPLRWDLAPPDRALAFARASKAPVYALLMDHEEDPFLARYGASFRRVRTLEGGALFAMNH